ncbi:MICAL-like protein 1 [Musca vetustissima]|uniref:MICAL-like protein 1 n=1 Tax=Musca vetustissima TaxID=27455 RepID=UPI002AB6D9C9|nr:MICAL-like protein 1 [Musca vetustissima]
MAERRGTKALELWCRRMTEGYPGVQIDNMTTSWRDGLAFCAMIHHFRPDLIDFDKLNKADVYYNNALAFTTAEKYLGIPALLDADDMAAYEVPDRLSILTYLSQYYQAFASQSAHNRLKRPSSSATEKTQISKPSGPPPKMAHVVGVPRRDPCRKCQLPVFLAERLLVGKKVYHRTCLKCARCGSQLTPGSFYETEVDEQYVCETCPDEEVTNDPGANIERATSPVQMRRNQLEGESNFATAATTSNARSVRSSIRDRLAFFEKQQQQQQHDPLDRDSKLLQKSLSDEEKSKSLQRMEKKATDNPSTSSGGYKMNSALSNFLNDTVDNEPDDDGETDPDRDEDESESLSSSIQNSKMETSDSEETDDLTSVSLPPELPKSLPPSFMVDDEKEKKKPEEPSKRFTASAQLILGSNSDVTITTTRELNADQEENIIRTSTPIQPLADELEISVTSTKTKTNDTTNNNDVEHTENTETIMATKSTDTKETTTIQQIELENNLACNETNDNDCVTKDKATVDASIVAMETTTEAAQQLESTIETATTATTTEMKTPLQPVSSSISSPKSRESSVEKELETSENREDVELRTKSPTEGAGEPVPYLTTEDKETTQRLSVVRARLQQFEVITNNEKDKESIKITTTNTKDPEPADQEPENNSQTVTITSPETIENESQSRSEEKVLEIETKIPTPAPREESLKMDTEEAEVVPQIEAIQEDNNKEIPTEKLEDEVPLKMETKDNEILEDKINSQETPKEETEQQTTTAELSTKDSHTPSKIPLEEYPEDLNPFKSDDEDDEKQNKENVELRKPTKQNISLNPFDSSDDEIELEKSQNTSTSTPKVPPPRPPPPRISKNPFGSEDEDEEENSSSALAQAQLRRSSLTASQIRRTPVPTPRSNVSQSLNPTPEPTPRLSTKAAQPVNSSISQQHNNSNSHHNNSSFVLQNSSDFYGSNNSLHSHHNLSSTPNNQNNNLLRNSDIRSSNNSLNLSAGGTIRSRKTRRAPLPPAPVKELFPSSETINTSSKTSTPSSSTVGTPKSGRKKRPAPAPPKPARLEPATVPQIQIDTVTTQPKNLHSYPLQSELDSKLSDEEKALLEGKTIQSQTHKDQLSSPATIRRSSKRLIPLDQDLLEEHSPSDGGNESQCDDLKHQQQNQNNKNYLQEESEPNVVYRRLLIPHNLDTPTHESNPLIDDLNSSTMSGERQLEKLKDNKEANNRNRQSQISAASSGTEDNDPLFNKSVHGKWKRRKGPAPALPIPPRRVLQMLPLQEIKHELDIIEVQQQGLEKQGVILEKMIRDRCEGENGELLNAAGEIATTDGENSKEVEGLILQLFELVNEKNELFRRQAELMYLRRQHRLEQEQADLEYEIRVLMAQPECNKTDSDKAREEAFIERLLEVVKLRNEVVECLEMDRLREAEEDQSIKQRLESHIASKRDDEPEKQKSSTLTKLSKKEKKKQKEYKKLAKNKKLDADKDADESELSLDKQKTKKKKKLLIF